MELTRELNETEKGLALTTSAAVHYLIRKMDELKHTNLYSLQVKQTGNQFLKNLEKHAHRNVWDGPVEGVDLNAAVDQMDQIGDMMHNLLILAFACSELPESDQNLFWVEINKQAKRFKMPIRMTHEGVMQYAAIGKDSTL